MSFEQGKITLMSDWPNGLRKETCKLIQKTRSTKVLTWMNECEKKRKTNFKDCKSFDMDE